MADYSTLKVVDLKAELKRRGIPQTGLRVKQNFIDKLIEDDSKQTETDAQPEETAGQEHETAEPDATAAEAPVAQEPEKKVSEPSPEAQQAEPVYSDPPPQTNVQESPATVAPAPAPTVSKETTQSVPVEPSGATQEPSPEQPVENEAATLTKPSDRDASLPEPAATQAAEPQSLSISADATPNEELADDTRKRKRRSQSPPPSPRTLALKRSKAEDGQARAIVKEDEAREEGKPTEAPPVVPAPTDSVDKMDVDTAAAEEPTGAAEEKTTEKPQSPPATQQKEQEEAPAAERESKSPAKETEEERQEESAEAAEKPQAHKRSVGDARFKGLFPLANGAPLRPESPPPTGDEDRIVTPSMHPATTSLYIRDLMRPLQPATLQRHLCSLATPPNASPDSDIIVEFFLDSIKTHCFVTFTSIAAASRVRTSLHDTIWPEERARKPLWVDFVPEEKVREWIERERAHGDGGRGAPRWEISYEERDDGITAVLQEASANAGPPRGGDNNRDASMNLGREPPTGPRADRIGATGPSRPADYPDQGFQALDDRFLSTAAKPKLYYLPVSREVSDKRLDQFDDLAKAGPVSKPGGDEMMRYTFEDTDLFVSQAPDFGPPRGRWGRGRGGGGGGRGDWGGSWRGGGGGGWRGIR